MNSRMLRRAILGVVVALFAASPLRAQHQLCFYVDKGIPGHCFVQFLPANGPQAGRKDLTRGKYPATKNIFGGPGVIKNDSKRPWSQRICYNVTAKQYNAAAAKVNAKQAAPRNYHLTNDPPGNCVDWMSDVAAKAGKVLPATKWNGIGTPATFGGSLKALGNGGVFNGGTVVINQNENIGPDGEPVAAAVPTDMDAEVAAATVHCDPQLVADHLQLPLTIVDLGGLTTNGDVVLDIVNASPQDSLISVNWGVEAEIEAQAQQFQFFYAAPAELTVGIVNSGEVVLYTLQVEIAPGPPADPVQIVVPTPVPAGGSNPGFDDIEPIEPVADDCPADGNGDLAVDVDDLVEVILSWGPCPDCTEFCHGDLNGDCVVDVDDLVLSILQWGPCATVNDSCGGALYVYEGTVTMSNVGATLSRAGDPSCTSPGDTASDVWYRLQPPPGVSQVTIDTNGSAFNTVLDVWTGPCDILLPMACDDDSGAAPASSSLTLSPAGSELWIRVAGSSALEPGVPAAGAGVLNIGYDWAVPPAPAVGARLLNDQCVDNIAVFEGLTAFSTLDATSDGPEHPGCAAGCDDVLPVLNDIWYAYTATLTGVLRVSTCGDVDAGGGMSPSATFDTAIVIYGLENDEQSCDEAELLTQLYTCNDNADSPCGTPAGGRQSDALAAVTKDERYLIRIGSGATGGKGTGVVFVDCFKLE